ncbi:MAG TPA: thiol peroxidase [Acidobacteriota bacterium]|nr:thiol peroxidase [Acidobacteriota bacterium]
MTERPGSVTLKGKPFTLVGPELKIGDKAPDFTAIGKDLKPVTLEQTQGKIRVFSVVPSLDTPVCDAQTRRFNQEAGSLPGVSVYTISMDLPFAQSRWCAAAGVDKVIMLSDHKDASFGTSYGTLIKELRLDSRAIFIIDPDDRIRYIEYVKEVATHPNYEAALEATRQLVAEQSSKVAANR